MAVRKIVRPALPESAARPDPPKFVLNDPRLTPQAQAQSRAVATVQKSNAVEIGRQVLVAPPLISPEDWKKFVMALAGGTLLNDALFDVGLNPDVYRRMMKAEPKLAAQVEEAKRAAARIGWPDELIDEILADIAMGAMVITAVAQHGGEVRQFYGLILRDPEVKERYDAARKIHLEGMIDDMLNEAQDDGNDRTFDGKGNSAAVNRSRLRIETRQWLMERLHRQRFAPKQQELEVTVNVNHVERLEQARKRSEQRNQVVATVEKSVTPRFPRP